MGHPRTIRLHSTEGTLSLSQLFLTHHWILGTDWAFSTSVLLTVASDQSLLQGLPCVL